MTIQTGFWQPAEWEKHRACWLAWPSHADLWQENLDLAQQEFTALCRAIVDFDPKSGQFLGEKLNILCFSVTAKQAAQAALKGLPVHFHEIPFGDIWLRDTAPIFMRDEKGNLATQRFDFNGWGEKYLLPFDQELSQKIASLLPYRQLTNKLILEGGSMEVDGEGTCLTTRHCLLNPNRNPHYSEKEITEVLKSTFGLTKVLWLDGTLLNDHTDGHIDTIARFCAPGVVLCMEPKTQEDPNREILLDMAQQLKTMKDAKGRVLQVVNVPSPGEVLNEEGEIMPASYMNFYIANSTVIIPTYASPFDSEAVASIARCFPGRKTVGLSARAILSGGGAFQCITQQEPSGGRNE